MFRSPQSEQPLDPIEHAAPSERAVQSDHSFRLAAHGFARAGYGSSGVRLVVGDPRRVALWELAGPLERRVVEGVREDVPSAAAVPIWHFESDGAEPPGHRDASAFTRSMRLYHVNALPGDVRGRVVSLEDGEPGELGIPKLAAGDRVYGRFNPQSGRWEILAPAEDVWRFELATALAPAAGPDVPATAEARLVVYDAQQGRYVTTGLTLQVADFLGPRSAPPGTRGYARRLADSSGDAGWEIIALAPAPGSSSSGLPF